SGSMFAFRDGSKLRQQRSLGAALGGVDDGAGTEPPRPNGVVGVFEVGPRQLVERTHRLCDVAVKQVLEGHAHKDVLQTGLVAEFAKRRRSFEGESLSK